MTVVNLTMQDDPGSHVGQHMYCMLSRNETFMSSYGFMKGRETRHGALPSGLVKLAQEPAMHLMAFFNRFPVH